MKIKIRTLFMLVFCVVVVGSANALIFEDNFDDSENGDAQKSFAKDWVIQDTIWNGPAAGAEKDEAAPTAPSPEQWAYFQTKSDSPSGIFIDTKVPLEVDTEYALDFIIGSRNDDAGILTTVTFRAQIWDGNPASNGTMVVEDVAVLPTEPSSYATNNLTLTSGSSVSSNLFLRFYSECTGDKFRQPLLDNVQLSLSGVVIIPSDPVTVSMAMDTQVELSWPNQVGKTFGVETNSNLILGDWQSLTSGVENAESVITVGIPLTDDCVFYRVITE